MHVDLVGGIVDLAVDAVDGGLAVGTHNRKRSVERHLDEAVDRLEKKKLKI